MASSPRTVTFLLDQLAGAGEVAAKKMFGEYGIFLADKMVGLLCDDQLFFKPTAPGRQRAADASEAAPYPGAKPCLLIPEDRWDDAAWLQALARATYDALPAAPKKRKQP